MTSRSAFRAVTDGTSSICLWRPTNITDGTVGGRQRCVDAFAQCIAMLEKADTARKGSHQCALKWIVHLAGDIHQPLHVACGYYRVGSNKIVEDEAA